MNPEQSARAIAAARHLLSLIDQIDWDRLAREMMPHLKRWGEDRESFESAWARHRGTVAESLRLLEQSSVAKLHELKDQRGAMLYDGPPHLLYDKHANRQMSDAWSSFLVAMMPFDDPTPTPPT